MTNSKIMLRKLFKVMNKDAIWEGRVTHELLAAYERQEAELVRSLENTRRVLALLRNEPKTSLDEESPEIEPMVGYNESEKEPELRD